MNEPRTELEQEVDALVIKYSASNSTRETVVHAYERIKEHLLGHVPHWPPTIPEPLAERRTFW